MHQVDHGDQKSGATQRSALPKPALGFSPVQATASGAGTHGGGKRRRNRQERRKARSEISRDQW